MGSDSNARHVVVDIHRNNDGSKVALSNKRDSPKESSTLSGQEVETDDANDILVLRSENIEVTEKADKVDDAEDKAEKVPKKKLSPKVLFEKAVHKIGKSKRDPAPVSSRTRHALEPVSARTRQKTHLRSQKK